MSLASGARLGAYEISAPIGAGGMGEVAIKVLPPEVAQDPERLGRFKRERTRMHVVTNGPSLLE